jgi:putative ATP-dependent endonuclease of the OLD family
MYLHKFHIKGYRSIQEIDLVFNKGVNIIIGENNSGKTAIIDALRLCLSYGSQFRDIYIDKDKDFYIDSENPLLDAIEIRFDLIFEIDDPFEPAVFTDFVSQHPTNKTEQTIRLHFKYYLELKNEKKILRWSVWGGDNEGQTVPTEALQLLSFTYLSPLRNAVEKLKPNTRGNKIAELYKNLKGFHFENDEEGIKFIPLNKHKKESLADKIQAARNDEEWKTIVNTGEAKVLEHINGSSIIGKEPSVMFNFLPYTYDGIVNNIDIKTPVRKELMFDITQNGLGENNIIYAATVLGDLINNNEEKDFSKRELFYQALLIEEPEAHLHPQKQNTFFKYLNTFDEKGIQLFITSHSPTITAKSKLEYLIVLQKQKNKISAFTLSNSELSSDNKKYLEKFLDVTKSQLFFSNGTILVEGISEALLLPVFAKKMSLDYEKSHTGEAWKYDLDKNGIEIVNVGGVAFDHFAKLYNSQEESKRLAAKCSLLTDNDKGIINSTSFKSATIDKVSSEQLFKVLKDKRIIDKLNRIRSTNVSKITELNGQENEVEKILIEMKDKKSDRATIAEQLKKKNLFVRLAEVTFEYELMITDKFNMRLMQAVYKRMHSKTDFLDNSYTIEERANEILEKLKTNKDKSDFAMNLSCALDNKEHLINRFVVPEYIQKAIQWVIPQ